MRSPPGSARGLAGGLGLRPSAARLAAAAVRSARLGQSAWIRRQKSINYLAFPAASARKSVRKEQYDMAKRAKTIAYGVVGSCGGAATLVSAAGPCAAGDCSVCFRCFGMGIILVA